MYTANELISFKVFYRKFVKECRRVSGILSKSERIVPFKKLAGCDSFELSSRVMQPGKVCYVVASGEIKNGDTFDDIVVTMFPYHYLSLSDEELCEKVKLFDDYAKHGKYIDEISEC